MFGSIIPAPLAIAHTTRSPTRTEHTFGPRSVVRMARAASSSAPGRSFAPMPWMAALIFSIGSATPMTPVHEGTMSPGVDPELLREPLGHRARVGLAVGREDVRVLAHDRQDLGAAVGEGLAPVEHRVAGAEALREDRRRRPGRVELDDREVEDALVLDARGHGRRNGCRSAGGPATPRPSLRGRSLLE